MVKRARGSLVSQSGSMGPEMPEGAADDDELGEGESASAAAGKKKARTGRGRERIRIALAPDQPPTTQGKQRERVYVACNQWYVQVPLAFSYYISLPH